MPDVQLVKKTNHSEKTQLDLDWEKQLQEANRMLNRRLQGVTEEEEIDDPLKEAALK